MYDRTGKKKKKTWNEKERNKNELTGRICQWFCSVSLVGSKHPMDKLQRQDRKCQNIKNVRCGSIRNVWHNESNKLTYQKETNINNNLKFRNEKQNTITPRKPETLLKQFHIEPNSGEMVTSFTGLWYNHCFPRSTLLSVLIISASSIRQILGCFKRSIS